VRKERAERQRAENEERDGSEREIERGGSGKERE